MNIVATRKTAAVAGAWAAIGLVPFESWLERHTLSSSVEQNLLWCLALAVFFVVPGYFLVLGSDTRPFDRTWFLDATERARYGLVFGRMLSWFLGAAVVGLLWSVVLGWFSGGALS